MDLRQIKELAIVILAEVTSVLAVVEVLLTDGPKTIGKFSVKQNGCEVMTEQHNPGRKKKREGVRNNETSL